MEDIKNKKFFEIYNCKDLNQRKNLVTDLFGASQTIKNVEAKRHILLNSLTANNFELFGNVRRGLRNGVNVFKDIYNDNISNDIKQENTNILSEKLLQNGYIPPEILYGKYGGAYLTEIDKNPTNNYTLGINYEMQSIFRSDIRNSNFLCNPIEKCKDWIDIGTGNGLVSAEFESALQRIMFNHFDRNYFEGYQYRFPPIKMYDLSVESLGTAKSTFNELFGNSTPFQIETAYFPEILNKIKHEGEGGNLITMINFLPNCNLKQCKELLKGIYDKMSENDVFMPTFFQESNSGSDRLLGLDVDYCLKELDTSSDQQQCQEIFDKYMGMNRFELSTLGLYKNQATEDWILKSFEKYFTPSEKGQFSVLLKRDESDILYVEVSIIYPSNTKFYLDGNPINTDNFKRDELGNFKFIAFNSYRLKWEDIEKLCKEVGFNIVAKFSTSNDMVAMPYLMKPSKDKPEESIFNKSNISLKNIIQKYHSEFDSFTKFCDIDDKITDSDIGFQNIFLKDIEKLRDHRLNKQYQILRKGGLSPYAAITELQWEDSGDILGVNKMVAISNYLGKLNIIIGIIALNEGIDYLNKHFKLAEEIKDGAVDVIPHTKEHIGEIIKYEYPNRILIYKNDEGRCIRIHPYQFKLNPFIGADLRYVEKINEGNVSEVAYATAFFIFAVNKIIEDFDSDLYKTIEMYDTYNEYVSGSETILRFLIQISMACDYESSKEKYIKKLVELSEKYPCIKEKFFYHLFRDSRNELENFVHRKYGNEFNADDIIKTELW